MIRTTSSACFACRRPPLATWHAARTVFDIPPDTLNVKSLVTLRAGLMLGALLCLGFHVSPSTASDTLYDALGRQDGIASIVKSLLVRVHADPRTRDYFDGVSDKRLQDKLSEQFCQLADGPCSYTGHSMKQAHGGLHINRAAFNALVEDLQDAMDENSIAPAAQNRLLARLAPMVRDVEQP